MLLLPLTLIVLDECTDEALGGKGGELGFGGSCSSN